MRQAWTTEQVRILKRHAPQGVRGVRRALARAGVRRTDASIQHKASQLGVSLLEHRTCPGCGREVRRLVGTSGLCEVCNERRRASAREQMADIMRRTEPTKEDADALRRARRAHDRARKRCERARRK